jgi:hypothetical protein
METCIPDPGYTREPPLHPVILGGARAPPAIKGCAGFVHRDSLIPGAWVYPKLGPNTQEMGILGTQVYPGPITTRDLDIPGPQHTWLHPAGWGGGCIRDPWDRGSRVIPLEALKPGRWDPVFTSLPIWFLSLGSLDIAEPPPAKDGWVMALDPSATLARLPVHPRPFPSPPPRPPPSTPHIHPSPSLATPLHPAPHPFTPPQSGPPPAPRVLSPLLGQARI